MLRVCELARPALTSSMTRRDSHTCGAYKFRVLAFSVTLKGSLLILCAVLIGGCVREPPALLTHPSTSVADQEELGVDSPYWHAAFNRIRLGAAEHELEAILRPKFYRVKTNTFLFRYPFKDLLPEVNPSTVTEWQTEELRPDGWPEILFTFFSDASKTNLVDAFWFKDGRVRPVIHGLFGRNVRAVKPGDSIESVFRVLGKRDAEYFRGSDGKWRVRFVYWAHGGRIFVIECDAAEGRVLYAGDGTI